MPAVTPVFLETLKSRISLVELVGQTVRLTRKGRDYWGCCPFHHEKTASFTVSDDKSFFHCFGCGEHGDAVTFAMKSMNLSFIEAVEYLAERAGMEMPKFSAADVEREKKRKTLYDVAERLCAFFQEQLYKPAGREGLFYLQRRGLTDETICRFRLGYAPAGNAALALLKREGYDDDLIRGCGAVKYPEDGRPPHDYFRERVMFPICDVRGRVIAFGGRVIGDGEPKYLNSPDTPLFAKGDNLYALHLAAEQARQQNEIMVVEGYMDVISLHQAGFTRAVASCGTAMTERQIELLWKYAPEPVCCFDGDAAGIRAANRAADRVLPLLAPGKSLRFLTLPDDDDPDEYITEFGREAFEKFVRSDGRPLVRQLWGMLTAGRSLDTPERKADLMKDMNETAAKIADRSVRDFYEREFRSLLWEATAPAGRKKFERRSVRGGYDIPSPRPQAERSAIRLLTAYLLLFPRIASEYVEDLAETDASADHKIKDAFARILEAVTDDPDLDEQGLAARLKEKGAADLYDRLAAEIEMLRTKPAMPEDARNGIRAFLENARRGKLPAELRDLRVRYAQAAARGDADGAAALWDSIREIQEQINNFAALE